MISHDVVKCTLQEHPILFFRDLVLLATSREINLKRTSEKFKIKKTLKMFTKTYVAC